MNRFLLMLWCGLLCLQLSAQETLALWTDVADPGLTQSATKRINATNYRTLSLDRVALEELLQDAPLENTPEAQNNPLQIDLPLPDGTTQQFEIVASPIMAPGLARQFPQIKTYAGKGVQNRSAYIRIDITHKGFHAMVLNGEHTWFIDPYFLDMNFELYTSYYKKDFRTDKEFECSMDEVRSELEQIEQREGPNPVGTELRTYRLAVATTGEYTAYHGGVDGAMSAIATTMNRVNGVYERDLSVRMILVDSNQLVIFTNANTDPYSGGSFQRRNQNQDVIDDNIGPANYDIGHVFDQGGGGVASIETVCRDNEKALGYTAQNPPLGDPFDIDYVAHEIGHQFGGLHTFNSCGSQGERPYEPGSATTIMGYAGICGATNIQSNSDDHFHVANFDDMAQFTLTGSGNGCAEIIPTMNTPPVVDAGPSGYIIPISTPFELIASAMDAEGDSLTYCWEQHDLGPSTIPTNPTGNAPLFRSFSPKNSSTRVFPRISAIVNNTNSTGEYLPDYSRTMSFRCTVRDNHGFGGGADWDEMTMSATAQAGPFRVTSQNMGGTWTAGAYELVTWDVANTDQSPVNATEVNVFLSIDGGFTYPITLAENLPNNGQALILVPDTLAENNCRVKVKGAGNVFFDINNNDFSIELPTAVGLSTAALPTNQVICGGTEVTYEISFAPLLGFDEPITLAAPTDIEGLSYTITPETLNAPGTATVTISGTENLASGAYEINISANGTTITEEVTLNLEVFEGAPGFISLSEPEDGAINVTTFLPTLVWEDLPEAETYTLEISETPDFSSILFSETGIEDSEFTLTSALVDSTQYYWRVRGANEVCGEGDNSSVYGFLTEVIRCETFVPEDIPFAFTNFPFINSKILIEDDLGIRDVNIKNVEGTKTVGEVLEFRVRAPGNVEVTLLPEFCASGNSFDISFDSQSPLGNLPCPYDNGLTYRPEQSMDVFNGLSAQGTWRFFIYDGNPPGELTRWELEICYGAEATNTKEVLDQLSSLTIFPNPGENLFQLVLELEERQQTQFQLFNAMGQRVLTMNFGQLTAGRYSYELDLSNQPSGMYFYQLVSDDQKLLNNGKLIKK